VLPPQVIRSLLAGSVQPPPDLSRETMHKSFAKLKALVGELNRRHIVVLAGTDGFGFDLSRELELYVEAGMSPAEALATATILPAQTYGLADKTGSIAVGKLAELALIDGDPSKNMSDIRQVEWVMRDGRLMQTADLRAAIGISGPAKRG
jgi:imidazolonepropionase-like amidohydrolase